MGTPVLQPEQPTAESAAPEQNDRLAGIAGNAGRNTSLDQQGTVAGIGFHLDPDTEQQLQQLFTYQSPSEFDIERMAAIRHLAHQFARSVMACCPRSPDRSAAIRHIREAVMTANASIVLRGASIV